jgi:carbamate kinase
VVVIAAGGGGVPVVEDGPRLVGVEAVVDKDFAAAILARDVGATALLILTDVPRVQRGFGTDHAEELTRLTVEEARALANGGEFAAGSMGPKVQAATSFVEGGGARAAIGDLDEAVDVLAGTAGTTIVPA